MVTFLILIVRFFFSKEIITHPNYQPSRRYDDIALIRVSSPIPFGDYIRPACLRSNMSDIDPDIQLIVTGWGRTSVESMLLIIATTNFCGPIVII